MGWRSGRTSCPGRQPGRLVRFHAPSASCCRRRRRPRLPDRARRPANLPCLPVSQGYCRLLRVHRAATGAARTRRHSSRTAGHFQGHAADHGTMDGCECAGFGFPALHYPLGAQGVGRRVAQIFRRLIGQCVDRLADFLAVRAFPQGGLRYVAKLIAGLPEASMAFCRISPAPITNRLASRIDSCIYVRRFFSRGLNVPESVGIQQHLLPCAARRTQAHS